MAAAVWVVRAYATGVQSSCRRINTMASAEELVQPRVCHSGTLVREQPPCSLSSRLLLAVIAACFHRTFPIFDIFSSLLAFSLRD